MLFTASRDLTTLYTVFAVLDVLSAFMAAAERAYGDPCDPRPMHACIQEILPDSAD
ncbi:Hypothetical predicted protein [Pelobates cultripes]|uniref:Uncharacterized protein n=1 Tax=Pelobates cultripes TaxID=61616 RepID=A0AAD1WAP5_PELCU|nr:Hypothetical predicted protein [Pelobates cultripes]